MCTGHIPGTSTGPLVKGPYAPALRHKNCLVHCNLECSTCMQANMRFAHKYCPENISLVVFAGVRALQAEGPYQHFCGTGPLKNSTVPVRALSNTAPYRYGPSHKRPEQGAHLQCAGQSNQQGEALNCQTVDCADNTRCNCRMPVLVPVPVPGTSTRYQVPSAKLTQIVNNHSATAKCVWFAFALLASPLLALHLPPLPYPLR